MIRSIEEIVAAAAPEEVVLSGWKAGQEWAVKLIKPSVINMAWDGEVPNPLITTVADMLVGGQAAVKAAEADKSNKAVRHIAAAALQEPTMEELTEAGVQLTDQQYLEIYAWVLGGIDGLNRFRTPARGGAGEHGASDEGEAKPDCGDRQPL